MPNTYDIERAYLGSILIDPSVMIENPVDIEDMQSDTNRSIYAAMRNVFGKHGKIDYLLLAQEYNHPAELADLLANTISSMNAGAYAEEIRKAAEARDILTIASKMANDAAHGEINPANYIEQITSAIRVNGTVDGLQSAADKYVDWILQRSENPSEIWGIPSPWSGFNRVTGGLHRKDSTLIFGDSGIGKTILILQIGFHAACLGYTVDFYELEMSEEELMERLVAIKSQIPTGRINRGQLTDIEKRIVFDSVDFIRNLPIRMSCESHWTSSDIRADQQKKRQRADIVIVDYLALLQDNADNAYQAVEKASKNLRRMAKDLDMVVLSVASQVKDGTIKGTNEVRYAQDMAWLLRATNENDKNDPVRDLIPDKIRNTDSPFRKVGLKFVEKDHGVRLPMFENWTV